MITYINVGVFKIVFERNGGEIMKNKKTFIVLAVLIAVLMLGIGYAAVSNIALKIDGSATASPNADNFVVKFTDAQVGDSATTTATVGDGKTATLTVTGLTAKGDTAEATYTVSNLSADLLADLTDDVITNDNTEYFEVTTEFEPTTLAAKTGTTTIKVVVELIKTPIGDADVTANIDVDFTAEPVQPTA